jgi:amino acid transporter
MRNFAILPNINLLLTRARIINLFAVKWYGESEFWLSGGKVVLIFMLFCFMFITMIGGNPKHDAYGFRYWETPVSFLADRPYIPY